MNIPGVTIAATPRSRVNTGRTPSRTVRKTPVKSQTEPKYINIQRRESTVIPIANIPPPTPTARHLMRNYKEYRAKHPKKQEELEWNVSLYNRLERQDAVTSPYQITTVKFNGLDVFIPPDINPEHDKIIIVDIGGSDSHEDGSVRYIAVKNKYDPVIQKHPKGKFNYISINDNGLVEKCSAEHSNVQVPEQKPIIYPSCATPRIVSTSPVGLCLNILSEMNK